MKKFIISLCLLFVTAPVLAGPFHHRHHHHHQRHWHSHHGWVWVAPTIIGGVIGYEIARNQQPVVVQQSPVIIQNIECDEWKEVRHADGRITQERICSQR